MQNLPIGIQTFENIINTDQLYVDKTQPIFDLIRSGQYYFLSRPRRFGKSLLLSTIKSYFEGKKELFTGLAIENLEKEWKPYPVVMIDYSLIDYRSGKTVFNKSLLSYLASIADKFGLTIQEETPVNYFQTLISRLSSPSGKVVVLVDEYDKPLVDSLDNAERFYENREILNGFYGVIKGLDPYLRFVLFTGVSRFSKVGVFSGMNNLQDISLDQKYSTVVGFTQAELENNFEPYLQKVQNHFNLSREDLVQHIKNQYNGYSWDGQTKLYNPFSILNFFSSQRFDNYWFSSGTPTFLMEQVKKQKFLPEQLEHIKTNDLTGESSQIHTIPIVPLLFQTGYLTIEKVEMQGLSQRYFLNYPNEEVKDSFITHVLAAFLDVDASGVAPESVGLRDALLSGRHDQFLQGLRSIFADIPSRLHLANEAYYHSLVYLILRMTGFKMLLEKETDSGRIDGVLELPDKIYILEFKFAVNKRVKQVKTLSQQALKQIKVKKYAEPYLAYCKPIYLLGLGFLEKELDCRLEIINEQTVRH